MTDLIQIADCIKSGELAMIYCNPGLGAIDMSDEQRAAVENALRAASAPWRVRLYGLIYLVVGAACGWAFHG